MDSLEDYQINNNTLSSDLSKNMLMGDKCHVGIIPLLVFKYKVLRRWVSCSFIASGLCPQDLAVLQKKTKTHEELFLRTSFALKKRKNTKKQQEESFPRKKFALKKRNENKKLDESFPRTRLALKKRRTNKTQE